MAPGDYLRGVLADGARPFRYRAGVRELLGLPDDSGVPVSFVARAPGAAFAYLRAPDPYPGEDASADWLAGPSGAWFDEPAPAAPGPLSTVESSLTIPGSTPRSTGGAQGPAPRPAQWPEQSPSSAQSSAQPPPALPGPGTGAAAASATGAPATPAAAPVPPVPAAHGTGPAGPGAVADPPAGTGLPGGGSSGGWGGAAVAQAEPGTPAWRSGPGNRTGARWPAAAPSGRGGAAPDSAGLRGSGPQPAPASGTPSGAAPPGRPSRGLAGPATGTRPAGTGRDAGAGPGAGREPEAGAEAGVEHTAERGPGVEWGAGANRAVVRREPGPGRGVAAPTSAVPTAIPPAGAGRPIPTTVPTGRSGPAGRVGQPDHGGQDSGADDYDSFEPPYRRAGDRRRPAPEAPAAPATRTEPAAAPPQVVVVRQAAPPVVSTAAFWERRHIGRLRARILR